MSAPDSLSAPIVPQRRIEALDIVRGFALFGVLMLNMLDFSGPTAVFEPWAVSTAWWDRAVELGIRAFGEAAFYTTFSFLFGLGFALQFQRALDRGERFGIRFATRLGVLAVFGLIHGFLIWDGDILLQYSVAGFFLLLFSKVSPTAAIRWAMGFAAFTVVAMTALLGLAMIGDFESSLRQRSGSPSCSSPLRSSSAGCGCNGSPLALWSGCGAPSPTGARCSAEQGRCRRLLRQPTALSCQTDPISSTISRCLSPFKQRRPGSCDHEHPRHPGLDGRRHHPALRPRW